MNDTFTLAIGDKSLTIMHDSPDGTGPGNIVLRVQAEDGKVPHDVYTAYQEDLESSFSLLDPPKDSDYNTDVSFSLSLETAGDVVRELVWQIESANRESIEMMSKMSLYC
jgi:hypothetical protein